MHAKATAGICDHRADGAKANDTEVLASKLAAGEVLLGLLGLLAHIGIVGVLLDPLDAAHDVTGSEQKAGNDHLLDGVGVGTGGVKDDDAVLCAALDGDVVDASASAGDGQKVTRKVNLVEARRTHHDGMRALELVGQDEALAQLVSAHLGDVVQTVYLVHGISPYTAPRHHGDEAALRASAWPRSPS